MFKSFSNSFHFKGPRARRAASKVRSGGKPAVQALEVRMVLAAPYPLQDTFALESLPGADHTIYLDFDGHTTTGTTWNSYYNMSSITSPAYDRDNNPNNFSNAELEEIQKIWQRAAEDFSPFDVNVTTKDPTLNDPGALINSGGTDTTWGTRVVMTDDTFANCGCGGFAFLNSFTAGIDEPVFAFNNGETAAAETVSHEVGHALGLSHDGQGSNAYYYGHNGWAPIMGAGFYAFVTQWSKGEYNGATNQEDDLAIITSATNGFGYRADDHSDTLAGATHIPFSPALNDAQGIIETSSDVDVFTFDSDGSTRDLLIVPAERGGNLDIAVDIYDSNNTFIGTSNHPGSLFAGGQLTLPAGTYSMHVYGTGFADPQTDGYSDYGSIGQYFIQYSGGYQATTVSIDPLDAVKAEGDNGTTDFTFTVTRSGDTSFPATVDYQTLASGIFPVSSRDFPSRTLPSGTVSFAPNQDTATVTVSVKGDRTAETDETFVVELSNPTGGMILNVSAATGTVVADDGTVVAMVPRQGNLPEGDSGATDLEYDVLRFGDLSGGSSLDYDVSTRGGKNTKASPNDFVGNALPSGTVSFAANESSQTIVIQVQGDTVNERDEKFKLSLSSNSGVDKLFDSSVNVVILNDDGGSSNAPAHDDDHDDHHHVVFQGRELHFTPSVGEGMEEEEAVAIADWLFRDDAEFEAAADEDAPIVDEALNDGPRDHVLALLASHGRDAFSEAIAASGSSSDESVDSLIDALEKSLG